MTAGASSTAAGALPPPPSRLLTRWVHRNLPRPSPPALVVARGDGRRSLLWTTVTTAQDHEKGPLLDADQGPGSTPICIQKEADRENQPGQRTADLARPSPAAGGCRDQPCPAAGPGDAAALRLQTRAAGTLGDQGGAGFRPLLRNGASRITGVVAGHHARRSCRRRAAVAP